MAGPMVSLIPGYNSSSACAKIWAEECQKACFPSSSRQVYRVRVPSVVSGVVVSTFVSLKEAEITFRASPSLILIATSIGVDPDSNCFTVPSGRVIPIIVCSFKGQRYYGFQSLTICAIRFYWYILAVPPDPDTYRDGGCLSVPKRHVRAGRFHPLHKDFRLLPIYKGIKGIKKSF